MPTASTIITIQQGVPEDTTQLVQLLGIGSAGDRAACRRLVMPSSVSPLLIPIVYQVAGVCLNPDDTFNMDNEPLTHPATEAVKTIGSTRSVSFDENLEDVIVTEVWQGGGNRASMTTALWRQFKEYLDNQPQFGIGQADFVVWEPRDKTSKTYNVQILSLSVGNGEGERRFNVRDVRMPGSGIAGGGTIDDGLDSVSTADTGLVDQEVRLRMRVVSEV